MRFLQGPQALRTRPPARASPEPPHYQPVWCVRSSHLRLRQGANGRLDRLRERYMTPWQIGASAGLAAVARDPLRQGPRKAVYDAVARERGQDDASRVRSMLCSVSQQPPDRKPTRVSLRG